MNGMDFGIRTQQRSRGGKISENISMIEREYTNKQDGGAR